MSEHVNYGNVVTPAKPISREKEASTRDSHESTNTALKHLQPLPQNNQQDQYQMSSSASASASLPASPSPTRKKKAPLQRQQHSNEYLDIVEQQEKLNKTKRKLMTDIQNQKAKKVELKPEIALRSPRSLMKIDESQDGPVNPSPI